MIEEKIAKIILYLSAFFLPLLVFGGLYFPYITSKVFVFKIIVEILFGLWLMAILKDRNYLPKISPIFLTFSIFVSVIILATIFSLNPSRSFWSNFERSEGLILHLHLLVFFIILTAFLRTGKDWFYFGLSAGISGIFVALIALNNYFNPGLNGSFSSRPFGPLGNSIYLAQYLSFFLFFLILFFINNKDWRLRFGVFYIFILLLSAFLLTLSRGPILGFIGGVLIALLSFLVLHKKLWKQKIILWLLFLVLLGGISLIYFQKQSNFVQKNETLKRLTDISFFSPSNQPRVLLWQIAFGAFKERPLLGWGPENFNLAFAKFYEPKLLGQEPWYDRSHNVILDWLVSAGILGALSYLFIWFAGLLTLKKIYSLKKIDGKTLSIFLGIGVSIFASGLFVFDNLFSYLVLFSGLGYVDFLAREGGAMAVHTKAVRPPKFGGRTAEPGTVSRKTAQIVIVAGIIVLIYFLNFNLLRQADGIIQSLKMNLMGEKDQIILSQFEKTLKLHSGGRTETREEIVKIALGLTVPRKINNLTFIQKAIGQMEEQVKETPRDPKYFIFLGQLYNLSGKITQNNEDFKKAALGLENALALSPQKQQIYLGLSESYQLQNDFSKARDFLRQAIYLEPHQLSPWLRLAGFYIATGQPQNLIELKDEAKKFIPQFGKEIEKIEKQFK